MPWDSPELNLLAALNDMGSLRLRVTTEELGRGSRSIIEDCRALPLCILPVDSRGPYSRGTAPRDLAPAPGLSP